MRKVHLKNKVIAITGSTGGLGVAAANALKAKGAKIALMDINQDALDDQVVQLGGSKHAAGFVADVRSMSSIDSAMAAAAKHFGHIDVVIAGAGVGYPSSFEYMDPIDFERTIDINLNGVFRTFRAAIPYVKQRQGYLLAISSMAAFVHSPLKTHYAASKAAVWAFCDSLRLELQSDGVSVGSLHPTFFDTPMMANIVDEPCSRLVWQEHTGVWKFVPLQEVIDALVKCIEQRQDTVTVPRSNAFLARAPELMRKMVARVGFNPSKVTEAVRLMNEEARLKQLATAKIKALENA